MGTFPDVKVLKGIVMYSSTAGPNPREEKKMTEHSAVLHVQQDLKMLCIAGHAQQTTWA